LAGIDKPMPRRACYRYHSDGVASNAAFQQAQERTHTMTFLPWQAEA
jgi:hypothetical protein